MSDVAQIVSARPRKASVIARVLAVAVAVLFTAIALGLHGVTDGGRGVFRTGDQIAMTALGLLGAAGILMFTRPRVVADDRGIRVRNVLGGYELPWELVRSVRFDRHAPWASLELRDDEVVAVMAVQAADKAYAVAVVRGLRGLLAEHQARTGVGVTRHPDIVGPVDPSAAPPGVVDVQAEHPLPPEPSSRTESPGRSG